MSKEVKLLLKAAKDCMDKKEYVIGLRHCKVSAVMYLIYVEIKKKAENF